MPTEKVFGIKVASRLRTLSELITELKGQVEPMSPKVVEIRNGVEGEVERVELSREASAQLIGRMYAAFAPMRLTGRTLEPPTKPEPLTLEGRQDYSGEICLR
jgi:hypothetical protein